MSCVHEIAYGMHRAYVLPDGTPGPCILCENDWLRAIVAAGKRVIENTKANRWEREADEAFAKAIAEYEASLAPSVEGSGST